MISLSDDDVYKNLLERLEVDVVKMSKLNSEVRYEAERYQKKYYNLFNILSKKKLARLGDLVSEPIRTGHTPSMKDQNFYGRDYHFIKTDNLRENEIRGPFTDYLSKKGYDTLNRVHLRAGDIIVTIIGATYNIIARSAMIHEDILPATINQNIALVRPESSKIVPDYLITYMNSRYGRMCLEYWARQTEQVNLNCQEIGLVLVPILSYKFQKNIKNVLQNAYLLLSESKKEYRTAEALLIHELDFDTWQPSREQISLRSLKDITEAGRIDAEYYQPKYDEIKAKLQKTGDGTVETECILVDKNFSPEKTVEYKYIELANIGTSGEITGCTVGTGAELPSRARRIVHSGDIIISSIEGSLQSCALISDEYDGALCSTGFYVLSSEKINSETLLTLFKSEPIQALLKQQCSGTILTAFGKDGLLSMPIPKIRKDLQLTIKKHIVKSYELRQKSAQLLEASKHAVEIAIERSEAAATEYLNNTI